MNAILAATHEFATGPADNNPNTPFRGTLQRSLRVDRSIMSEGGFGKMSMAWGELEIINADGYYDNVISLYAADGRRVKITIGQLGRPYYTFRTIFDGTSSGWHVDEDVLRISLRDNGFKLDVPASPNLYAGTGDLNGGTDLKGKRKPLLFGAADNVSPALVIPSQLVYQVHDGWVNAITAVYDRGAALTFAADYATGTLLRSATIAAGSFATCLNEGLFRLGAAPAGTVTADVQGDKTGGIYASTTETIVRRLLTRSTTVSDPTGIVIPSFTALAAVQPAVVGYYLGPDQAATVRQVLDDLLGGIGAWGDFRRDGLFQVGRFGAPGSSPTARYTSVEIIEISRLKLPAAIEPPPWRRRVTWGRNWTVQTELAGAVSASRVAYLAEEFRTASATSDTIRTTRPLAQDPEPSRAFFRDEADAAAEAQRLLTLYSQNVGLYRIALKLQPYLIEIGETIHVTHPRWGLTNGKFLTVVGLSEDPDQGRIEVTAFG